MQISIKITDLWLHLLLFPFQNSTDEGIEGEWEKITDNTQSCHPTKSFLLFMLENSIFNFTHNNLETHEPNQLKACLKNASRISNQKFSSMKYTQMYIIYVKEGGESESDK